MNKPSSKRHEPFLLGAVMLIWFLIMVGITFLRYSAFDMKYFDHGINYYIIEHLRNYGSWVDYAGDVTHRLGNHFSVIQLLFVPFQYLSSSPITMYIIQLIICAFGALGVYLIADHFFPEEKSSLLRIFFPIIYLCYFPFIKTVAYDFDVSRFAPTFIIFLIYFAIIAKRHVPALLFVFLICITRETLPLVVAGVGLFIFVFQKNRKIGIFYMLLGFSLFMIIVFAVMPFFKSTMSTGGSNSLVYLSDRYSYIQGNTNLERIIFCISHPLLVAKFFFLIPWFKWISFLGLSAFLLFIPFIEARYFTISLFVVFVYFLSGHSSQFEYKSQYFSEIYPAIFVAFIPAFKRICTYFKDKKTSVIKIIVSALLIISCINVFTVFHYHFIRYTQSKKFSDEFAYVLNDHPGINKMKDDEVALFLHNRIFVYYKWKRYMTSFINYHRDYPLFKNASTVKKMYIISINEPELGEWSADYNNMMTEASKDGFKKIFEFKKYIVYEKILRN